MCLAQGHNAVTPVRLKPTAPSSRVKRSTTELPVGPDKQKKIQKIANFWVLSETFCLVSQLMFGLRKKKSTLNLVAQSSLGF